jgi:glycosyltransferase involved in cell wall biosynthesis
VRHFKKLKIVDLHDIQTNRIRNDLVPTLSKWKRGIYEFLFRFREKTAMNRFDQLIAISPVEEQIIKSEFCPAKPVLMLPITFETPKRKELATPKYDLLLVGSNSAANVQGVEWFLQEAFPRIIESVPNVNVLIQGNLTRNPKIQSHPVVKKYGKKNIFLEGFRENLAGVYADARIVICPIRQGTGMKVKVIEALAYGKPVVGTSIAFEGIDAADGEHAMISDNPYEFASSIVDLIADPVRCARIGMNGFNLFKEKYHFQRVMTDLQQALASYGEPQFSVQAKNS